MLVHHAQSAITLQGLERIAAYDRVMGDGAAVRQGRRAFAAHRDGRAASTRQEAQAAFREAVARAGARLGAGPAFDQPRYLVGYLGDLATNVSRFAPASALEQLAAFERGNAAWRRRQACQAAAARDARGVAGLVERASRSGLAAIEQREFRDAAGTLVAWRLAFRRN
jgi:hypothetical protein